jgi:gamma-glutamylputrescine oxidase
MTYQSPISPGFSWYEATAGERPDYPALDGDTSCDVAIIGGGFTGLSAAAHLAKAGVNVVLVEQARFGDGASGRNGGQMGTGQRAWPEEQEEELGFERAKALFDLAEEAKNHLRSFAAEHDIDIDYRPGQLSVIHKKRYVGDYRRHAELMAERFDYPHISYMEREETAERVGSSFFHGGIRDTGTGHVHPLKLVIGTARVAAAAGAQICTRTPRRPGSPGRRQGDGDDRSAARSPPTGRCSRSTPTAIGEAGAGVVGACDADPLLHRRDRAAVAGTERKIIPGSESIDDSRFVVRYFRKFGDDRLLFGGREAYTADNPREISTHIRKQIAEIYPELADVEITHAWGGSVGITMPRHALRARGDAGRDGGGRLFRPRRDAVELHRQALCRGGDRQPRPAAFISAT